MTNGVGGAVSMASGRVVSGWMMARDWMMARGVAVIAGLIGLLGPVGLHTRADGAPVRLEVSVPANTPAGETVYVAGSFQGWNPGSSAYALTRQADGRWAITLDLPAGSAIEYKFTRGTWARVEKGATGEEIPNRRATVGASGATLAHAVGSWADLPPPSVTGRLEVFRVSGFLDGGAGRTVRVLLPEGYGENGARHPVLYMHDGQNLFDPATSFAGEWRVDESAAGLIASGAIEPVIVVGIDNGPDRCGEYTPFPDGGSCGRGEAYLREVREVLMPAIQGRYRTRLGPGSAFMAGSSLGGLISAYAGLVHADAFGRVAAVSPSYWWADEGLIDLAGTVGLEPRPERFYQDMGTAEGGLVDSNGNGVDDDADRVVRMGAVLEGRGLIEGEGLRTVIAPGHTHSERYWAERLPSILAYLIDPPRAGPICPGDLNGDGAADMFDAIGLARAMGTAGGDGFTAESARGVIGEIAGGCVGP